jgi:GWxTD domain-containing protein
LENYHPQKAGMMEFDLKATGLFSLFLMLPNFLYSQNDTSAIQQEETLDYYEKWLKEDVVYIINEEEREVFLSLSTPEEKEQFIEQFWTRRDPDPTTALNEYKEEHYRRIAYANDRFTSAIPGWRTDRGRIYIIHGEPAEIESHPNVGAYDRPLNEGGGYTTAFPFEIWRYREIEGLGSDILIEFVDPTMTGEYRLAERPEDKDALMFTPGSGLTLAEQQGLAGRADRPFFKPGNREKYPYMIRSSRDNPFARYETYAKIQGPVSIRYNDLKEMVRVNLTYGSLPFGIGIEYFSLNPNQVLVPVSLQLKNCDLMFKQVHGTKSHVAKLAVYGIVSTMANQIVSEFENDLETSFSQENLQAGLLVSSIYQKVVVLDSGKRYKLDLVVKDLNSNQVGVKRIAVSPPRYSNEGLEGSALILSKQIQVLDKVPNADEMFVLGDVKILPNITKKFIVGEDLGVYFQVYNIAVDQSALTPSVSAEFSLFRDGNIVSRIIDSGNQSLQFFSGERAVFIKEIPLRNYEPGQYSLRVKVADKLREQAIVIDGDFTIAEPD